MTTDVVATTVEICEQCRTEARGLFVQMVGKTGALGPEGKPWWLCFRCWLDGIRPMAKNEVVPSGKATKKRKTA